MLCPKCVTKLQADFQYCPNCSQRITHVLPLSYTSELIDGLDREPFHPAITQELRKYDWKHQDIFLRCYTQAKKGNFTAYLMAMPLGLLHRPYLGYWKSWFVYLLSLSVGIGLIWWIIDLIRLPKMVEKKNQDIALDLLEDLSKIARSG